MGELGQSNEPLMKFMRLIIRMIVRILAVMMTVVISLGAIDVAWMMHEAAMREPRYILTISDILATFGAFMAVLIAIEIFVNIILYLRDDVIHVKIVMATALMAVARKVIIIDFDEYSGMYVMGLAATVLAMSIGYWLIHRLDDKSQLSYRETAMPPEKENAKDH